MSSVKDLPMTEKILCEEACSGCKMSLMDFARLTREQLFDFLRAHLVILKDRKCPTCNVSCTLYHDSNSFYLFRCQRSKLINLNKKKPKKIVCNFKESLRLNTFFSKSKLPIEKICEFIMMEVCLNRPLVKLLEDEFEMSRKTVIDWCSFLREVYLHWVWENTSDQIGGEGVVVEIDETKLGKRKYHRARVIEGQWLFGGIERTEKKRFFMVPVPDRTKETLLDLIKKKIAPGSIIYSDCWKSYECLEQEGFTHLTVNHSLHFVGPDTGTYTQNFERFWRDVKDSISRYGRKKDHYPGYLARFYFRKSFKNHCDRIHAFFLAIGSLYNPTTEQLDEWNRNL